ncbi:cobalamin biosynthesis protein [Roseinatronobacter sp. NSM]|uniref:cobalamin biosynthesis protein n=1 Tax=Roseinatronobacter sp. NSM TaxID=3457785 RepID=UPI004035F59A
MIVAGFGCSSRAGAGSLRRLMAQMAQLGRVDALACLESRAALLAPVALAAGVPLITVQAHAIGGVETPTQSDRVRASFGTGSVAEACALVAAEKRGGAGKRGGARIVLSRVVSDDGQATCALARGGRMQ